MSIGDKVRVINSWIDTDGKKLTATIDKFQVNGTIKYAKVRWLGRQAFEANVKYGNLFPLDELRKV